jgi:AbiV family abortive infection protein
MSLSTKQLDELIDAMTENACSLIKESDLLLTNGYHARAYSLAHFAREELSKCFMLHAAANKLLAGVDVDWKKLMRRFRSHQQKLIGEQVQMSVLLSAFGNSEEALASLMAADAMADKRNDDKTHPSMLSFPKARYPLHQQSLVKQRQSEPLTWRVYICSSWLSVGYHMIG